MLGRTAQAGFAAAAGTVVLLAAVVVRAAPPAPSGGAAPTDTTSEANAVPGSAETDTGDIVETIDPHAGPEPATPTPRPAALPLQPPASLALPSEAPSVDRFELHGFARQSLELGLSKPVTSIETDGIEPLAYDRLSARTQLFLRARYSREGWFEANVSGVLSYSAFIQDSPQASSGFEGPSDRPTRGVLSPELYELSVGLFSKHFDLRIGQQRVAWGKSDFMSPNDVVNARDLRDPFTSEPELRHIPTFLLRAEADFGFARLEAMVAPVFTPDRYDVYGSNWAAIQPDAPGWARGLAGIARRSLDPTLQDSAQRVLAATSYPGSDFTAPVPGAHFSWSAGGVDLDYYYQYGFDGPSIELDPGFAASLDSIDFGTAGLQELQPWFAAIDAGKRPLRARYVRRHHLGMDVETTLGPFALRLDAAYDSQRVFFRSDMLGAVSPAFEGVIATEYQTGDKNKLLLLEVIYLRIIDPPAAPLLIYERDTLGIGGDLRWTLWRGLGVDLRALVGIKPSSSVLQPEVNVRLEPWVLSLGGLWLDGEAFSLGQHFHRNTEAYAKAKLLF
jgi:hypothetical protein